MATRSRAEVCVTKSVSLEMLIEREACADPDQQSKYGGSCRLFVEQGSRAGVKNSQTSSQNGVRKISSLVGNQWSKVN